MALGGPARTGPPASVAHGYGAAGERSQHGGRRLARSQTYRIRFGEDGSVLVRASSVEIEDTAVFRDEAGAVSAVAEPRVGGPKLTISGLETDIDAELGSPGTS